MKHLSLLLLSCSIALFALQSCGQEPDYMTRTPIFRVVGPDGAEDGEIFIDGKSQYIDFTVLASDKWSANLSGDEGFSLPVATGGAGKTNIQLKAAANEGGKERSVKLSFLFDSSERSNWIIRQREQQPYLEISPKNFNVSGDADEISISIDTNQEGWSYEIPNCNWIVETAKTGSSIVFTISENNSGKKRSADIRFYATNAPEVMDYCEIVQNVPAVAPTADLLDVVFDADGSARDVSAMGMTIVKKTNSDCSVAYVEKYGRNVAKFNNSTIARSKLSDGYYKVPYTVGSSFANKLADGFTYELLFCDYEDAQKKQVKPFASTQAGGLGLCTRASTGEINFEVHTGGSWNELYSGIIPQKGVYYHVVAVWDKSNGIAKLYVDGQLTASKNTNGDLKFMDTSVDSRWFGIGADADNNDLGEASFYGEVVIARLYDNPVSAEEVLAMYKLVK